MTSFGINSLQLSSSKNEGLGSSNKEQSTSHDHLVLISIGDSFKRSLDREYKLLNSSRSPPKSAREVTNEVFSKSQGRWIGNSSKGFDSKKFPYLYVESTRHSKL